MAAPGFEAVREGEPRRLRLQEAPLPLREAVRSLLARRAQQEVALRPLRVPPQAQEEDAEAQPGRAVYQHQRLRFDDEDQISLYAPSYSCIAASIAHALPCHAILSVWSRSQSAIIPRSSS